MIAAVGNVINKLKSSEFNRSIAKLLSGGAISAIVTIITLPIISRLYSPTELGAFHTFLSVVVIFSVSSSFKYEMAIALPKNYIRVNAIFTLCILSLLLTTVIYSLVFLFLGSAILSLLSAEYLKPYLWLFPPAIFITGCYQIVEYLVIQKKLFGTLAKNKLIFTGVNQGSAISLGFTGMSYAGLMISYLAALLVCGWLLLRASCRAEGPNKQLLNLRLRYLKKVAGHYRKFPVFNLAGAFLIELSIHMPVFVFGKYASTEFLGYYVMANRLLEMPVNLVVIPVRKVYLKYAADAYDVSVYELRKLYLSTLKKLIYLAVVGVLVGLSAISFFIPYFLGGDWDNVVGVLQILLWAKFFQFLNSPLSSTLVVIDRMEIGVFLVAGSVVVRFFSMISYSEDPWATLVAYTVSTSIFYILYNYVMYRLIRVGRRGYD